MTHNSKLGMSNMMSEVIDVDSDFLTVSDSDEMSDNKFEIPDIVPILPLRNTVIFPGVIFPISVGRDKSLKLVRDVYKKDKLVCAVAQINENADEIKWEDIHKVGTVAQILKILEMPDGSTTVILQGRRRVVLLEQVIEDPYLTAIVSSLDDEIPEKRNSSTYGRLR